MLLRAFLLLTCYAGLAATATAAEPCPVSCTTNGFLGTVCSSAALRDSSSLVSCYPNPGQVETHASYDLQLGMIEASAVSCYFASNGQASVLARDRFRLHGPPGGGAITFEARLQAYGAAGGFGTVSAAIQETGVSSASVNDAGYGGFNQVLTLALVHVVGDEFEMVYTADASAHETAVARGTLSFAGLPSGYGVTSCQGFMGDGAVPTRRATWGAVKLHYR